MRHRNKHSCRSKNSLLLSACVSFIGLLALSAQPEDFTVTVDAKTSWGALPHFWSQCHAFGRLGLVGRDTLQRHIADVTANLGVKMLRFHAGISDAQIYNESGGTPVYTWTVADSLYDILVRTLHVKPFIELDWVPRELKSTEYAGCGNYCPPKDYEKWKNLVFEFVNHLKERYGAEEIETWRFETWNEAEWFGNYGNPGPPSLSESYKLQKYSTEGALLADSNIVIGGPATSGYDWEKTQSGPYLDYAGANNMRVDFLSYHAYHERWKTIDGHFLALDTMAAYNARYPALHCVESCNTEYNMTYKFNLNPEPAETEDAAVFVADVMTQIALRCHTENRPFPFAYAYWVISDVFDEGVYRAQYPFIGCMGYISRQDIRKPVYNTFRMLNMLGSTFTAIVTSPDSGTVKGLAASDSSTNGVQVLIYNADTTNNTDADNVALTIHNINAPSGKVHYRCYLLDKTHSNSYQTWQSMGGPAIASMSEADWTTLRASMNLETVDSIDDLALSAGSFSKNYSLTRQGVLLATVTPTQNTAITQSNTCHTTVSFKIRSLRTGSNISLNLKAKDNVTIRIFDSQGKLEQPPVFFNAGSGQSLRDLEFNKAAGVYFIQCVSGGSMETRKIMVY
ncbi:MAG: T9SS type A sorting domain-containing protein [Chitinivibrionales bacterium]|nr:T9SS type A sorting domain-containing protein [Chitinivibrionales bacterium]